MPQSALTDKNKRSVFATAVVLLAANLLPIVAVLKMDWTVYDLLVLYWFEMIVIGMINVVRMILIMPVGGTIGFHLLKIAFVPFFAGHFGLVCVGLGGGIQAIFGKENFDVEKQIEAMLLGDAGMLFWPLVISHLFSFFWNYINQREFRKTTITRRMIAPYLRIIPLAGFSILAVMGCLKIDTPLWSVIALIAGKGLVDLVIHVFMHLKCLARPDEGSEPGPESERFPVT